MVLCAQDQEIEMQFAVGPLEQENHQLQCLPGFLYNTTLSKCECYPDSNVRCVESEAFLNFGSCIYDISRGRRNFSWFLHIIFGTWPKCFR